MLKKILTIVFAILLFLSYVGNTFAVPQARDSDGTVVTLTDAACENAKVLAPLPRLNELLASTGIDSVTPGDFQAATVLFKGKIFHACWALVNYSVLVIDDGNQPDSIFIVPLNHFRNVDAI